MREKEKWQQFGVWDCVKVVCRNDTALFVEYQPGNGTRYSVCFTFLGNIDREKVEDQIGGHDTIVSIESMRKCMTVGWEHYTSPTYVAEKFGFSMADAEPVAALINLVCRAGTPYIVHQLPLT